MPRYPLILRLLHWAVALVVLWQVVVGLTFLSLSFEETVATFGKAVTDILYLYHKSFGIVILIMMLARLGIRLACGKPPYRPPLAPFERRLSRAVQAGLYIALIVQPLLGLTATAAGGFPIGFFAWTLPGFLPKNPDLSATLYAVHGAVGILIVLLALLHIAGALRHWLVLRDGVMRRITLP